MSLLVVGMADGRVSDDPARVLVTYALGSCIALAIHDPVAHVGGLVHFMLPDSAIDPEKAGRNAWMFADTAIPLLFRQAYELGAVKRRLAVRVAGGARLVDSAAVFNIGKRNCLAMRKILWKAGVLLQREDVGGSISRSVRLDVGTGAFSVRAADMAPPAAPALAGKEQQWPSMS